jgi:hypothetical protein
MSEGDQFLLSLDTDSILGQESRFWSAQIKVCPLLVRRRTS